MSETTAAPETVTTGVTTASEPAKTDTPAAAAPAAAPAPEKPAAETTTQPRRDARSGLRDAARAVSEAFKRGGTPAATAAGEGKDDPAKGGAAPAGHDAPAADASRAADGAPDAPKAADARPAGPIRVEVRTDHPIRGMGLEAISAASQLEADAIQALLSGTYTRRKELEEATTRASRLETEKRELSEKLIRLEAHQSASQKWTATPEYAQARETYQRILDEHGESQAQKYWAGVLKDFDQVSEQEYKARMDAIEVKEAEEFGARWTSEAWERAQLIGAELRGLNEFPGWFEQAVDDYNTAIEKGRYPNVKSVDQLHDAFVDFFGSFLMRQPAVRELYARSKETPRDPTPPVPAVDPAARQRELEQAAADAVERYKREAADTRTKNPPHPLGGIAAAAAGGRGDITARDGGAPDTSELTADQIRRQQRQAARQDSRRHLPMR